MAVKRRGKKPTVKNNQRRTQKNKNTFPVRLKSLFSSIARYSLGHKKRSLIFIFLIIIIIFAAKRFTSKPEGITEEIVTRKTLRIGFTANGEIKARNAVDIKFYSPGKVSWIGVKKDDKVKKWQAVAKLDTVSLNSAYMQALNNYRKYQSVTDSVLDSLQDHENDETFAQRAERTTAEVDKDNAYDSVLAAQSNLKNATLFSPIAGIVTETSNLVPGLNLSGADIENKFIRVVDPESYYFEAQVDEVDFSNTKLDQEVAISLDAYPYNACKGVVSYIGKEGEETLGGVITVPAEVDFILCGLDLMTGFNGQAQLITEKVQDTLVIPKKYIIEKEGQNFVWLKTGDNFRNKKLALIKTGMETASETEVVEGLNEGDRILYIPQ